MLLEVIISKIAGGFLVPSCLLFEESSQALLFALLGVFEEFISFDLLADLIDESLKFVFGFSQLPLDCFLSLIPSE